MVDSTAFYVSTTGNDHHPGTLEYPFKTIGKARDVIRGMERDGTRDVAVFLRGGVYQITCPIEFGGADSGMYEGRVTYRSYPGERAVISGGTKVSGWVRDVTEAGYELWKVYLPQMANMRHLYVDGRRAVRARGKVMEPHGWDVLKDDEMEFYNRIETFTGMQGEYPVYGGYKTPRTEMANWKNQSDIEFVFEVGWTHSRCPVDEIVRAGDHALIRMKMPCFRDCQIKGGVHIGSPNYIENAFELLDEPGEWYFDGKQHILYYIPLDGEEMEKVEAVVPVAERLMSVQGSLDTPIRNISFEEIDFCYSTWQTPSFHGYADVQSGILKDSRDDVHMHSAYIKTPSAIVLDAAHKTVFKGCSFKHLGSGAIDIQNGSCGNLIDGCIFDDISGSGIQVGDFTVKDAHPEDHRAIVSDNRISNNFMHDIGAEYAGGIPVIVGYAGGTVIRHNEICCAPHSGISVGWGWGYWDAYGDRLLDKLPDSYPRFKELTVSVKNIIEYNHIHHVMQRLHDGAGIYTLSMQPDSVIYRNHIHDNGGYAGEEYEEEMLVGNSAQNKEMFRHVTPRKGFAGGIYMDQASGGFTVRENVVYNVAVPFFYHVAGIEGCFATNRISDNYFNIKPGDDRYPHEIAEFAGIEVDFMMKTHRFLTTSKQAENLKEM